MKKFIRNSLILITASVPLIYGGARFANSPIVNELFGVESEQVQLLNSNTRAEDSYYADDELVEYRVHEPSSPTYDGLNGMAFQFSVEVGDGGSVDEFADSFNKFSIQIEQNDTLYGQQTIAYKDFNSETFGTTFKTDDSGSKVLATFYTDGYIDLDSFQYTGDERLVEMQKYQFRIVWNDIDGLDGSVEQYTIPTTFTYGVNAPVFSYKTFEGNEQALVELDLSFTEAVLPYWQDGYLVDLFTSFKMTWGDNQNINIINEMGTDDVKYQTSDFVFDKNFGNPNNATMFFLFDDLSEGDEMSIHIDYALDNDVFGVENFKGESSFSTTFDPSTYKAPQIADVVEDDIEVYSFKDGDVNIENDQSKHHMYADVMVPVTITWEDLSMPAFFMDLSKQYAETGIVSEVEFQEVISSFNVNSISNSKGVVDPSTVHIEDVSGTTSWDVETGMPTDGSMINDSIHKDLEVYFDNLALNDTYTVDFNFYLNNPELFGTEESSYISNKVTFRTPSAIELFDINIDSVTIPTNEDGTSIDTPDNWNELELSYSIDKPDSWKIPTQMSIQSMINGGYVDVMIENEDEDGNIVYDVVDTYDLTEEDIVALGSGDAGPYTLTIPNLDSGTMYWFQINFYLNEDYERMFGFDAFDGEAAVVSSSIASGQTRSRIELPKIVRDDTTHDKFDKDEDGEYVSNSYSYGFQIISPDTWTFATDATTESELVYFLDNVISDVYISDVYSLIDPTAPGSEELYEKTFGLVNDEISVDDMTNTADNQHGSGGSGLSYYNMILVDGLTTGAYAGTLYVELTPEASDAATGWLNTDSQYIEKEISINTGDPYAAPVVTIDSASTVQSQDTYSDHSVDIFGTIDITSLEVKSDFTGTKEEFFEQVVLNDPLYPANIKSTITLTNLETLEVEETKTLDWNSFIDSLESDGNGIYSFMLEFGGLNGNSNYSVDIANDADYRVIEEITDVSTSFFIQPNEALDASNLSVELFGYEYGSQNEVTNTYDTFQLDLSLNPPAGGATKANPNSDYYDDLSKNINSISLVDSENDFVLGEFDPEQIGNLSTTNTISLKDIDAEVDPKTVIDLSKYKLVITTNEYTDGDFEVPLRDISLSGTTVTTGGLATPEVIGEFELTPYRDILKATWEISNMNNIDGAVIEIQHKDGIGKWTTVDSKTYDSTNFNIDSDESWVDEFSTENFIALNQYRAVLSITPDANCESTEVITYTSDVVTSANSDLDIEFDITNVSSDTESIQIDMGFIGNSQSVDQRAWELRLQVVDQYGEPTGTDEDGNPILPIIYEATEEIYTVENKDFSVNINNDNLLPGMEMFSNQEYKLNIDFTTYLGSEETSDYVSITTALAPGQESDSDLLTIYTEEKANDFSDSFSYIAGDQVDAEGNKISNEDYMIIEYTWNNKHIDDDNFKNIDEHVISIYDGGTVGEESIADIDLKYSDSLNGTHKIFIYNEDEFEGELPEVDSNTTVISSDLVIPNAKFTLTTNLQYDVYGRNSREYETEVFNTKTFSVPYDDTFIETTSEFIDNDSISMDVKLIDYTSFSLSLENTVTFYLKNSEDENMDFIYDGEPVSGKDGLVLKYADLKELSTWKIDEDGNATFHIDIDGANTPFQENVEIDSQLYVGANDHYTYYKETITNNTPQSESITIDSNTFYTLDRELGLSGYYYEINVDSNLPIGEMKDVYISEKDAPTTIASDITVVDNDDEYLNEIFEYDSSNLYIVVDEDLVIDLEDEDDLSFLVGRYVAVDDSNLSVGKSGKITADYSYFLIEGYNLPPLTWWEWIILIIEWILIILLVLLLIALIIGFFYYLWRITFSNKRWYPIVERIANEKFRVFTDYIDDFGWTHKYQEYADLSEKNTSDLREYALKMNIPITFDMSRTELLQTVSLLTDDEIQKFESFIENDVDIRNYEVLDNWKEERYKPKNPWIRYKLSKLMEKGVLTDDDDRLKSLHSELEYIKKEKETHAEREDVFEEIKALVSEVLDTNIELTSEFAADPLAEFKKELESKAEAERIAAEEAERTAAEEEERRIREEEEREAERQAKIEYRAKLRAEKEAAENEKEINKLKTDLKTSYPRITKLIEAFNESANGEAKSEAEADKLADSLYKERAAVEKFIVDFQEKQDRIDELGGTQKRYPFDGLAKVNVKLMASKEEIYFDRLSKMTKKDILEEAKKQKTEVKASWSKAQLIEDIITQLKERGDF